MAGLPRASDCLEHPIDGGDRRRSGRETEDRRDRRVDVGPTIKSTPLIDVIAVLPSVLRSAVECLRHLRPLIICRRADPSGEREHFVLGQVAAQLER